MPMLKLGPKHLAPSDIDQQIKDEQRDHAERIANAQEEHMRYMSELQQGHALRMAELAELKAAEEKKKASTSK